MGSGVSLVSGPAFSGPESFVGGEAGVVVGGTDRLFWYDAVGCCLALGEVAPSEVPGVIRVQGEAVEQPVDCGARWRAGVFEWRETAVGDVDRASLAWNCRIRRFPATLAVCGVFYGSFAPSCSFSGVSRQFRATVTAGAPLAGSFPPL